METIVLEIPSAYELERHKPMPSKLHSIVQANIVFELKTLYPSKFDVFSELTLDFVEGDVVPDISVFPKGTLSFLEDEIRVNTPPTLAIEILSPTQSLQELLTNLQELLTKSSRYFQNGVQSYWLVIPPLRSIHVFSSPQEYEVYKKLDTLQDDVAGIQVNLSKIFPI